MGRFGVTSTQPAAAQEQDNSVSVLKEARHVNQARKKESSSRPSPEWNRREMNAHASASCTAECTSTRTRPRVSGFTAQASQGSKSPAMSAIRQQGNEQYW